MTEAEWLACDDAECMLHFLGSEAGERRLRLFAVAAFRRVREVVGSAAEWERSLDVGERHADGNASREELPAGSFANGFVNVSDAEKALRVLTEGGAARAAGIAFACATRQKGTFVGKVVYGRPEERPVQAALLRDIFGHPFSPVAFDPAWRTDTAVVLSQQMYDSRDFGEMPILADALQEAGCDSEAMLSHCRDASAPHVRGCWVVDSVLGRE